MVSFTDESTEARPNQPLPLSYVRVDFRLSDVARSGSPYASLALGNVRSNATAVGPFFRVSVCPLNVSDQSSEDPSPPVSNANSPRALKIAAGVVASRAYTSTLNGSTRIFARTPVSTNSTSTLASLSRVTRARALASSSNSVSRVSTSLAANRAPRASLVHPHAHRPRFHPLHASNQRGTFLVADDDVELDARRVALANRRRVDPRVSRVSRVSRSRAKRARLARLEVLRLERARAERAKRQRRRQRQRQRRRRRDAAPSSRHRARDR